ncbi:MAG: NADH-quinone oxidoreductase subunit N [Candidatus Omnitrophica bacterium]|nr:NADH-quinone oxidoreductase subunit N [Candidatus Omnitrophota bacterium]
MPILPELVVTAGGLLFLALPGIRPARLSALVALVFLASAFDLTLLRWLKPLPDPILFSGMLNLDRMAVFVQLGVLFLMGLIILSVLGFARESLRGRREPYALFLLTTAGLLFLAGAQHLALIYVALEMVSILSYLLTGITREENLSIEAALKYFLFGSLATGGMLYGISLIYGLTGTLDLAALSSLLPQALERAPLTGAAALILLVGGLGFKLALVPFHAWAPDAYEGAPTPVAAFISVGPKLAVFAVLARLFLVALPPQAVSVVPALLTILCLITMTFGNVVALAQTNVKRLLAYSSIAQAGTMTIGLAVATPLGLAAALYYLAAYLLMNVGVFAGVIAVANASGREDLGAFSGLSRRAPLLALLIAVCLFSLAGIPPTAGFLAKLWIFGAALKAGSIVLAVAAAVNAVIAVFYYMKIVKAMYFEPAASGAPSVALGRSLALTLVLCAAGLLVLGLAPGPWLSAAGSALPMTLQAGDFPWL